MFATPPVEFRNSGNYGNSGKRCGFVARPLWNSGILGIMGILGRDVISLGPLEFRNSGNYVNSGKRCHITGPSGIPEFLDSWNPGKDVIYHWALCNSGIPGNFGILGREGKKNEV